MHSAPAAASAQPPAEGAGDDDCRWIELLAQVRVRVPASLRLCRRARTAQAVAPVGGGGAHEGAGETATPVHPAAAQVSNSVDDRSGATILHTPDPTPCSNNQGVSSPSSASTSESEATSVDSADTVYTRSPHPARTESRALAAVGAAGRSVVGETSQVARPRATKAKRSTAQSNNALKFVQLEQIVGLFRQTQEQGASRRHAVAGVLRLPRPRPDAGLRLFCASFFLSRAGRGQPYPNRPAHISHANEGRIYVGRRARTSMGGGGDPASWFVCRCRPCENEN